jgi:hypothetical protein
MVWVSARSAAAPLCAVGLKALALSKLRRLHGRFEPTAQGRCRGYLLVDGIPIRGNPNTASCAASRWTPRPAKTSGECAPSRTPRTRGAKVARTCLTSSPKAREPPWMEPLTPSGSSTATPGCGLGSNARPHSQAGVPVPPPTAENSRPPASSCTLTLPIETHGGRRGWRSLCRPR